MRTRASQVSHWVFLDHQNIFVALIIKIYLLYRFSYPEEFGKCVSHSHIYTLMRVRLPGASPDATSLQRVVAAYSYLVHFACSCCMSSRALVLLAHVLWEKHCIPSCYLQAHVVWVPVQISNKRCLLMLYELPVLLVHVSSFVGLPRIDRVFAACALDWCARMWM